MASITTRSGKGSPLTNAEVDANFTNLNDFKVEKDADTGAAFIPVGTEAQRPGTPAAGMFRFNDDTDQFEGYNGSAWGAIAGGGGGLTYSVKTANYTAVAGEGILADTSGGAFTVTLPATPSAGDQVVIADAGSDWETNNLTIARNGSTIEGASEDLTCDVSAVSIELIYDGSTWEVFTKSGFLLGEAPATTGKAIAMAIVFG